MPEFPDSLEEGKATSISLLTAVFMAILLTFIAFLSELIRVYIPSFTPWLEKLLILIVLCFLLGWISKYHSYLISIESYLLSVKKKKS